MSTSQPRTKVLIDTHELDQQLRSAPHSLPVFRSALEAARSCVAQQFRVGVSAPSLVHGYAQCIDQLLSRIWQQFELQLGDGNALVAVGGYGRGELHPWSDVDLMVLRASELGDGSAERIAAFVANLFDIGLEVGYSVRTVDQCADEARREITVATSLMEARLLAGPTPLFEAMLAATGPQQVWPSRDFFEAKSAEQRARHHRYNDTVHNLEPNIKHGPGGLRDIQMIGWVAKRHFGAATLHELVDHGFLTQPEYELLIEGQTLLWRIRMSLHLLAGRGEERLLFDHQRTLAEQFGYRDDDRRLAVEHFMKPYYRMSTELSRLNEMLLSLFQEAIVLADGADEITPVNERFAIRNGFLETVDDRVFLDSPLALFELFLIAQTHPEVQGVRAATIRLVRAHRHLIDDAFRADPKACELFVAIISQPKGITHELRRMHRYGLLGLYLPEFGAIEGQMQHDLFHAYTVDEHSLFVVGNLRGFAVAERAGEFPLCSEIIRRLPKAELVYLAGLFHDIAKGRGGDHSQLGAHDASNFCLRHGMGPYDAKIVAWLVEHHLLMSVTAQRKDISDPQVINAFAMTVGDQLHLDCLYLLTVADIRGTNPNLWNDWKDTLLKDLYETTQYALGRGLENPIGKTELIDEAQREARRLLSATDLKMKLVDRLWQQLPGNYFLRADPEEIAWHSQVILQSDAQVIPLIALHAGHGGTDLFVYTRDQHALFASIASTLDRLGLSILDARIITTEQGMTLDTFVVVEADGSTIQSAHREFEIQQKLATQLREPAKTSRATRRRPYRGLRHFPTPTQVKFDVDHANQRTVMEVITSDRPGLLSQIGWALVETSVNLQNAKIATFGERAEDMFYVTDDEQNTLSADKCEALKERVVIALEQTVSP